MKTLLLTASALLLLSTTANAECASIVDLGEKRVFLSEITELHWCWPEVTGAVGNVSYVVESSTNLGDWVVEGETDLPEWTVTRNIGDSVVMRYYACDEIECTDYSKVSQKVNIFPNFDFYEDGFIDGRDFILMRGIIPTASPEMLQQLQKISFTHLVDGLYIR